MKPPSYYIEKQKAQRANSDKAEPEAADDGWHKTEISIPDGLKPVPGLEFTGASDVPKNLTQADFIKKAAEQESAVAEPLNGKAGTVHDIPGVWDAGVVSQEVASQEMALGVVWEGVLYHRMVVRELIGFVESEMSKAGASDELLSQAVGRSCIVRFENDNGDVLSDPKAIEALLSERPRSKDFCPLSMIDVQVMFLAILRATKGDEYRMTDRCKADGCEGRRVALIYDLSQVDLTRGEPESLTRNHYTLKCDRYAYSCSVANQKTTRRIKLAVESKAGRDLVESSKGEVFRENVAQATLVFAAFVDSVTFPDGTKRSMGESLEARVANAQQIPVVHRLRVMASVSSVNGAVDLSTESECPTCKKKNVYPLDVGQNLFLAQSTQMSWDS